MPTIFSKDTRNITSWPNLGLNYWGITKCGNTSIKHHLFKQTSGSVFTRPELDIHDGVDTEEISPKEANENGHRNFCVVRHPVSRFFSMYKDMCLSRPERGKLAGVEQNWSPLDLINFIMNVEDRKMLDVHFVEQNRFIKEAKNCIIIKLERLSSDWPFSFPYPKKRKNVTEILQKVNFKLSNVSTELENYIYQFYSDDYKILGYDRDIPQLNDIENNTFYDKVKKYFFLSS
tara:strand:- start:107 stop:802 length:696 start_codon:yes stop_codon:yes gene_type:complete